MHKLEPTKRQREALHIISNYIVNNGYPPSNREVGAKLGVKSPSTTQGLLVALKNKGYITWKEGQVRTLKVIKQPE